MPAEFYDHPSGRLFFRAPAGGGGSQFDGAATPDDIRRNPDAYRDYLDAKHTTEIRAQREANEAAAAAQQTLKAEETAPHEKVVDAETATIAP